MGTVSSVTGQLGGIAGCTPADCCSQIDAIKGELARVNARIAALESGNGKADNALQVAQNALNEALGAKAQASGFAAEIGGLHDDIFGLDKALAGLVATVTAVRLAVAGLAPAIASAGALAARAIGLIEALSALVAPLLAALPAILVAIGAVGALGLTLAAIQTQLNAVESLANTAFSVGNDAFTRAINAMSVGTAAGRAADAAAGVANAATDLGNRAIAGVEALGGRVGAVESVASGARGTADRAIAGVEALGGRVGAVESVASGARGTADRAIAGVEALGGRVGAVESVASGARGTADRAIAGVEALGGRVGAVESVASGARGTADRALDIAQAAASRPGIAGRDGKDGVNGKDADTIPAVTTLTSRVGALENRVGAITTQPNTVNPGKEDEIIRLLQGTRFDVLALPAALVANPTYRAAITSAAAVGSCQSSRPGGCPGGTPDRFNSLDSRLNGISSAFGALNNAVLGTITSTLNVINTKLGSQITGGLSAWSAGIAEVVNRSQILNILTYISVLHNAYFLSNSLAQTLFSTIGNSLAALGIKDTSKDPAGTPFNIGKIVGDWTEGFFKATFGVATVEGIKADWKKYSRIYQAAAQVMYSVQSIGHSILGALEVVGSHVSKIGNALQKFRAVGEKAYGWMNPQPFFQNRFFTGLQATQEVVSQVDQVASEVLSVQETITQLGKNKDDLTKSVGEDPNGKKADITPEAAQVKVTEDAAKAASKSPEIPESSQVKP